MIVRAAELTDRDWLEAELAADFFREGSVVPRGTAEGRRAYVHRIIQTGLVVIALSGSREGNPRGSSDTGYAGSIALERREWPWAPGEAFLGDLWWHAKDPRATVILVRAARAIAKRRKLDLWLGSATGYEPQRIARYLLRNGGRLVGTTFLFRAVA